jgi:hypothetical protein
MVKRGLTEKKSKEDSLWEKLSKEGILRKRQQVSGKQINRGKEEDLVERKKRSLGDNWRLRRTR